VKCIFAAHLTELLSFRQFRNNVFGFRNNLFLALSEIHSGFFVFAAALFAASFAFSTTGGSQRGFCVAFGTATAGCFTAT
jgi:hypothetical protein